MKLSRAIISVSFVASVCILAISPVAGVTQSQGKVTPQMVLLHVRVVDPNDNPLTDVPQSSFQVTKGKPLEKAVKLLNQLARDTGGRTYYPSSPGDVQRISNQIIKDIRTQYVIGYVPAGGDAAKSFHKVEVSVAEGPNQEKRAAITRVGYQNRK